MTIFSLSNSCVRPTIVLRRIEREQASEWVRERERARRGEERPSKHRAGKSGSISEFVSRLGWPICPFAFACGEAQRSTTPFSFWYSSPYLCHTYRLHCKGSQVFLGVGQCQCRKYFLIRTKSCKYFLQFTKFPCSHKFNYTIS